MPSDPDLEQIREAIRKLPPYPFRVSGDTMATEYIEGLKGLHTPEGLLEFTNRWSAIWTINFRNPGVLHPDAEPLVNGTYNPAEVLPALNALRVEIPEEDIRQTLRESSTHRVAAHIMAPSALMEMLLLAQHFNVPVNMAWIQAAGMDELF
jgi:hypothetical protein